MFLYYFCGELNHTIMKKTTLLLLAAAALLAKPAFGQSENTSAKKSKKSTPAHVWSKVKDNASMTSDRVVGFFGIGDGHEDETKIDGTYYMPVYDTNLYNGSDAQSLKIECEKLFKAKYPNVVILSEAIPQKDWITEDVKQKKRVVAYQETLYCFILARDGDNGYINSLFAFQRYRKAGGVFETMKGKWPEWQRTDIVPNEVYAKLTTKK